MHRDRSQLHWANTVFVPGKVPVLKFCVTQSRGLLFSLTERIGLNKGMNKMNKGRSTLSQTPICIWKEYFDKLLD